MAASEELIREWTKSMNMRGIIRANLPPNFPEVITLCGSTRFKEEYEAANRKLTLEGKIVISVGLFGHKEAIDMEGEIKKMLDILHFRKIDYSDSIHVVSRDGYIGSSTMKEIAYAYENNKMVCFQEPKASWTYWDGVQATKEKEKAQ